MEVSSFSLSISFEVYRGRSTWKLHVCATGSWPTPDRNGTKVKARLPRVLLVWRVQAPPRRRPTPCGAACAAWTGSVGNFVPELGELRRKKGQ